MATLDAVYSRGHADSPVVLTTTDEVDTLIDRVRAESPPNAPILMDIHVSGDPYTQGLDVGVSADDRGIIRYAGRDWPGGVLSTNGDPGDDEKPYFYMDNWTDFPANAEIPLDVIRQAIKQFMRTDGARPTCIEWQPHW